MSYPKRVVNFLMTGITTDLPTWLCPPNQWTDGNNVVARNGAMQRVKGNGSALITPSSTDTNRMLNVVGAPDAATDRESVWILVTPSKQYAIEVDRAPSQFTEHDITISGGFGPGAGGAQKIESSLITLNNLVCHAPDVDIVPMYWTGDIANDLFVALPGWSSEFGSVGCRRLRPLKFHLVALGFEGEEDLIAWSAAADPGTVPQSWTAAADNDAGSIALSSGYGGIVAAERFGEALFIYKQSEVWTMEFVGGNDVFAFRNVFSDLRPLGPEAVCDLNNKHAVLTHYDLIVHDGNSIQSIANNKVRKRLFDMMPDKDDPRRALTMLFHNHLSNELWVVFEETNNEYGSAAILNLASNEWSFREFTNDFYTLAIGNIQTEAATNFYAESLVIAERTPALTEFETDDDTSLDATLKRHDLDFGMPERFKFIRGVRVLYQDTTDLEMRVGYRNELTDSITWQSWQSVTDHLTYVDLMGKFISVELRTESSTDVWTVGGLQFEYEERGYF